MTTVQPLELGRHYEQCPDKDADADHEHGNGIYPSEPHGMYLRDFQHPSLGFELCPSSVPIRLELHGCCNAATNGNGERDRHKGNPHFAPPFAAVDDRGS